MVVNNKYKALIGVGFVLSILFALYSIVNHNKNLIENTAWYTSKARIPNGDDWSDEFVSNIENRKYQFKKNTGTCDIDITYKMLDGSTKIFELYCKFDYQVKENRIYFSNLNYSIERDDGYWHLRSEMKFFNNASYSQEMFIDEANKYLLLTNPMVFDKAQLYKRLDSH